MNQNKINIFWFRRDLRLEDNRGLYHALNKGNVLPIFIFDTNILSQLPDINDARITYIFDELQKIDRELNKYNSAISIFIGDPVKVYKEISEKYSVESIFFNEDYEPYAIKRDKEVISLLKNKNISTYSFQDHIINHPNEVLKADNTPYTVYTPYAKKWTEVFLDKTITSYSSDSLLSNFIENQKSEINLKDINFKRSSIYIPPYNLSDDILLNYQLKRDFPSSDSTSHLGIALRFGTISIRKVVEIAKKKSITFLNELIWREFFIQILYHFPKVINQSFKSKYDHICWLNNENDFELWKKGETGYPIVDAGMRELNTTGFMHNRVRMITASFLCKHLLIDWRWGEAYFASKLLDFELASNNGNWQWAAGCGCDAAPYFRVFNPKLQVEKFDPNFEYIKKWVPEFQELYYPSPIVEHSFARNRAIETYKRALT